MTSNTDIAFCIPNDNCYKTTWTILNTLYPVDTISPQTRLYFLFARPKDIRSYINMLETYPSIRFVTGASVVTSNEKEHVSSQIYHRIYQDNVFHKSTNVTFINATGNDALPM
jgi:hypothetical protein